MLAVEHLQLPSLPPLLKMNNMPASMKCLIFFLPKAEWFFFERCWALLDLQFCNITLLLTTVPKRLLEIFFFLVFVWCTIYVDVVITLCHIYIYIYMYNISHVETFFFLQEKFLEIFSKYAFSKWMLVGDLCPRYRTGFSCDFVWNWELFSRSAFSVD